MNTEHSATTPPPLAPQEHCSFPGSRDAMEPLYSQLLEPTFKDSASAVGFCRAACHQYGFTVKQETSANKHIYVYCSREGLPDSQRRRGAGGAGGGHDDDNDNDKASPAAPKRRRVSKRCDCRWRVVLSETTPGCWRFRRSLNARASEHNHAMMSPDEIVVQHWPAAMSAMIVQLARDRVPTHDIRARVQHAFPDVLWNERRFYNRLTEERKRMRSRDILHRSRRLLLLLSRLTSLAAANEHWAAHVESEMARLFDQFCQTAHPHIDPELLVLGLDPDTICHDSSSSTDQQHQHQHQPASKSSRRELRIHIPSYTLAVTPQKFRQPSLSSPPSATILGTSHLPPQPETSTLHSPSASSLCPSECGAYNDNTHPPIATSFLSSSSPVDSVTQAPLPFDFPDMVLPKQPEHMFLNYGLLQQQQQHQQQQHQQQQHQQQQHHHHPHHPHHQALQRLGDPLQQGPW